MSSRLDQLPPRDDDGLYNVVIETPKGSPNKLAYDPKLGTFKLKSVMPEGSMFPFDFGFIPGTKAEDGDPLDVLVLMDHPLVPGAVVPSRLIGVITGKQSEDGEEPEENDRLVAVSPKSPLYKNTRKLSDLPAEVVEQVAEFFVNYNEQHGKRFEPQGNHGPKRAERRFEQARQRFKRRRAKTRKS